MADGTKRQARSSRGRQPSNYVNVYDLLFARKLTNRKDTSSPTPDGSIAGGHAERVAQESSDGAVTESSTTTTTITTTTTTTKKRPADPVCATPAPPDKRRVVCDDRPPRTILLDEHTARILGSSARRRGLDINIRTKYLTVQWTGPFDESVDAASEQHDDAPEKQPPTKRVRTTTGSRSARRANGTARPRARRTRKAANPDGTTTTTTTTTTTEKASPKKPSRTRGDPRKRVLSQLRRMARRTTQPRSLEDVEQSGGTPRAGASVSSTPAAGPDAAGACDGLGRLVRVDVTRANATTDAQPLETRLRTSVLEAATDRDCLMRALTDRPEQVLAILDGETVRRPLAIEAAHHPAPLAIGGAPAAVEARRTHGAASTTAVAPSNTEQRCTALVAHCGGALACSQLAARERIARYPDKAQLTRAAQALILRGSAVVSADSGEAVARKHSCIGRCMECRRLCACTKALPETGGGCASCGRDGVSRLRMCICGKECEYESVRETIGTRGCAATASVIEADFHDASVIDAKSLWRCKTSGRIHVCTPTLCSTRYAREDGVYACEFTGRTYGTVQLPSAESHTSGGFHPSAGVARANDDAVIMSNTASDGRPHIGDWRLAMQTQDARNGNGNSNSSNQGKRRQRQARGKARDVAAGRSALVTHKVLVRRCSVAARARHAVVSSSSSPGAVVASPEGAAKLIDVSESVDAQGAGARALAEEAARERGVALGAFFARWVPGPVAPPRDLADGYRAAIEITALAVISLPESADAPLLSEELAATYVDKYAMFVWKGWALASWYASAVATRPPPPTPQAPCSRAQPPAPLLLAACPSSGQTSSLEAVRHRMTETDSKRVFDVTTKLRQLAFGLLYQAKFGFSTRVDISSALGFAENEELIRTALATAMGVPRTADVLDVFSERYLIWFFKPDHYLVKRLVEESDIGPRGSVEDGIRVDGTLVNEGIALVKTCFSGITAWSVSLLVADIVAGVNPHVALAEYVKRTSLAIIGDTP
jgi:hypothetical protein